MTVFASTPFQNSRNSTVLRSLTASDNTIASLSSISFSTANDTVKEANNYNNKNNKSNGTCVVHNSVLNSDHKEVTDNIIKQPSTMLNPFSFDARQKLWQARKQERVNKLLDEQNKVKAFRAKPLPKFVKTRQVLPPKDSNNKKIQNTKVSEKLNTKTNEPKKDFRHIKPPLLLTTARALERKRFDDAIKEKEKKKEELKQMENILKKQQEERELAKLRRQTVHKAQPVPNYKNGLPAFRKRAVTDPSTPLVLKRRRIH